MFGWPVLVHYCEDCHYNTPVEYSPHVWKQEHICTHCGVGSSGADIAGKQAGAMNQNQHDELAALFAQRMSFMPMNEPISVPQLQQQTQDAAMNRTQPQLQSEKQASQSQETPVTFISSHYTHTTHIRPSVDSTSEPSYSPPPPYHDSLMSEAMAQLLRENSIDPSSLLPNQVHLFANADYEQRLRLLELWRIAPPSYLPLEEHVHASWAPTSVEQEETLARVRYECTMANRQLEMENQSQVRHDMGFDTHIEPISPIREPGETPWPPAARMRAASIASSRPATRQATEAEPYIIAGYRDTSQHQQRLDPVYAAGEGLWQAPSYARATQDHQQKMEDQYGSWMQIRNHADWESMNERIAREKLATMLGNGHKQVMDEDMAM